MSNNPEVWYQSGTWAWLTVLGAFIVLMLIYPFFISFVIGAAVATLIWIFWPHLAFYMIGVYNDGTRHREEYDTQD